MKNAVNQDNWFKRNLVRLYLGFVILILLIICIGTLCDTFYYLTGEKTEATVLGVSNYRVKTGSRHQTSSIHIRSALGSLRGIADKTLWKCG